jgi:hypothetical protein
MLKNAFRVEGDVCNNEIRASVDPGNSSRDFAFSVISVLVGHRSNAWGVTIV